MKKVIYRTSNEQLYDAKTDQFLADRFVMGLAQNVAMKKLMAINVVQP
jgi:methionyl-tRNA synthetase